MIPERPTARPMIRPVLRFENSNRITAFPLPGQSMNGPRTNWVSSIRRIQLIVARVAINPPQANGPQANNKAKRYWRCVRIPPFVVFGGWSRLLSPTVTIAHHQGEESGDRKATFAFRSRIEAAAGDRREAIVFRKDARGSARSEAYQCNSYFVIATLKPGFYPPRLVAIAPPTATGRFF